jgi:hypothetical protein
MAVRYGSSCAFCNTRPRHRGSRDVSEEIAVELMGACAKEGRDIPAALEEFIDRHRMPWPEQLPLPLRRSA